jgi:hypothetical protein
MGAVIYLECQRQSTGLARGFETLFQPEATVKGFSPGTKDFRPAEAIEKGYGRIERRKMTLSTELKGYLKWPGGSAGINIGAAL